MSIQLKLTPKSCWLSRVIPQTHENEKCFYVSAHSRQIIPRKVYSRRFVKFARLSLLKWLVNIIKGKSKSLLTSCISTNASKWELFKFLLTPGKLLWENSIPSRLSSWRGYNCSQFVNPIKVQSQSLLTFSCDFANASKWELFLKSWLTPGKLFRGSLLSEVCQVEKGLQLLTRLLNPIKGKSHVYPQMYQNANCFLNLGLPQVNYSERNLFQVACQVEE